MTIIAPPPPPKLTLVPPPPKSAIAPPPPPRVAPAPPAIQVPTRIYKTFDFETYLNYVMVVFHEFDYETGETFEFNNYELYGTTYYQNGVPSTQEAVCTGVLNELNQCTVISFNGIKYDNIIMTMFVAGRSTIEMKTASDDVIVRRMMPWEFERRYKLRLLKFNHIDIIEVAFGTASLKVYGARLKSKILRELPIHPSTYIMPIQRAELIEYCENDNVVTAELFIDCVPAIDLRVRLSDEYGVDFRSKSDAQIGEAIIVRECELRDITLRKPNMKNYPRTFFYNPPPWIAFETETMNAAFRACTGTEFEISQSTNKVNLPKEISKLITLGTGDNAVSYKMGIGGLHSVTSGGTFFSTDEYEIFEIDVSSFYPNIILQCGFHIPEVGETLFGQVYGGILDKKNVASERLKSCKDLSDAEKADLKATIAGVKLSVNGFYGKTSNHHSKVFAPSMLIHTTLTGQLGLFMLLEQLHKSGIHVLSANTDGINVRVNKSQRAYVDSLVQWWCKETGFVMDYNHYAQISYRDVNNYFYIHKDGYAKGIGIFAGDGIRKSPDNSIVRDAIFAFAKDGIPIEQTVHDSKDPFAFLTLRKVTGGAMKDGVLLGGTVRWYRSAETDSAIVTVKANASGTHNQVAGSECGMPLMNVDPDVVPPDIDREWYVNECYLTMAQIGMFEHEHYLSKLGLTVERRADLFDAIGLTKAMIKKYKIKV